MLNVALIGFGGITAVHRSAYAHLAEKGKARLVCACDTDPAAFEKKITINLGTTTEAEKNIRFYTDLEEMLAKEEIDVADVCLPTFLHAEMTEKLLRRGYHVLCEKPMALTSVECGRMLRAAKESGKELMIGQCVRFFPAYNYLKEAVGENRFGALLSAAFQRLSPPPLWGWENWFMNPARSGGCITDLHIHDVDVIRYIFGEPDAVSCRASTSICLYDSVHTSLFYGSAPVLAVGDWTMTGVPFEASYRVCFEKATVILAGGRVTVFPKDGTEPYQPEIPAADGYEAEIEYFCDVIAGDRENTKNPAVSAARTLCLIEHMRKSISKNGAVIPFTPQL